MFNTSIEHFSGVLIDKEKKLEKQTQKISRKINSANYNLLVLTKLQKKVQRQSDQIRTYSKKLEEQADRLKQRQEALEKEVDEHLERKKNLES